MKKLLFIVLFGVLALGCENLLPNEQSPNSNAIFVTDSNDAYIIEVAGGELVVTITTNVDYSIVIPEEAKSWLSVADTRAEARMEKQTFIIAENDTFETRLANVEFVDDDGKVLKTILFSQKCDDKVFTTDVEGNYIVIAEGGEVNVAVTTNLEYSVAIPEEVQKWLSVADTRAEIREETLTFIVAENETFEERSVSVELVNGEGEVLQIIIFVQDGQAKVFESDGKGSYTIKAVGGEVNVAVTTNLEYSVAIPTDAQEWLSVADTRAVIREETLTFIVAENETFEERSASVELVDNTGEVLQTISFIQSAAALPDPSYPSNEIWYTNGSTTEPTYPNNPDAFGVNIVSNTYDAENERWVIEFDGDVTTIGGSAFEDCDSLTSVTIPDSVTAIGNYAFSYCYSLTSVTIPNSVTTIGEYAFYDCSSLESVTIGDSVTTIGVCAFEDCTSLTSVYISDISAWFNISFSGMASNPLDNGCNLYLNNELVTDLTIPNSVTTIVDWAFFGCYSLTSVTIPDSVTTIGKYAFSYCSSLTSLTIPDSVTTIGSSAFQDCTSLTSVTIGDSVTTIGDYAFFYCSSLISVTIPDSVTTIRDGAFCNCSNLTSVTIPNSVTSIGSYAFYDCSSLTSVYCKPTTPPIALISYIYWDAFDDNASGRKIYVPTESVEAYKSAKGWSSYKSSIVGYEF